jgi:type IV pilus assembly protein PilF
MYKLFILVSAFFLVSCVSASKENQEKSELYLSMAASHIESGNLPFALRDLLSAEKLTPESAAVQNNLGLVYFLRERYDLAEKHLKKALDLLPTYTEARNNLARVYVEMGRYREAEDNLSTVLSDLTYPSADKAYINLGLSKFNQKQYAAAQKSFEKVIMSQNDHCIANTYRGRCLFELQEYDLATRALDRAVGFCQKELYDEPHYYSALAYYRKGDKSKAIARFEEVIKYYPNGKYRDKAIGMLDLVRKGH